MEVSVPPQAPRHERFRIVRHLGEGGMGLVFEAEDLESGEHVALKTLKKPDAETLFRLKREFRALEEVRHRNLVRLRGLVVDEDLCFVTMELVSGESFLSYVRHVPALRDGAPSADGRGFDEGRLRRTVAQVVLGLEALHDAGKVHRDVKPDNILVTVDERVVLVDFGLVAVMEGFGVADSDGHVVGTAEYMAPEQGLGDAKITPAADLYAVGAMLYEALTGQVPFTGPWTHVLSAKLSEQPPSPATLVGGLPTDLVELCVELLAIEPEDRPTSRAVLERLGGAEARQSEPTLPRPGRTFMGREGPFRLLVRAAGRVRDGETTAVTIAATSGYGKTTLVRAFLFHLADEHEGTVILSGRCYEREAVPFKAMDSLVDELSAYWLSLDEDAARALVPPDAGLLGRLFPVLGRVPLVAESAEQALEVDAQELRTRAFSALRGVFRRIGEVHPLVLSLDDLQWVDPNTLLLLSDLLRPPDPPAMLLVLASRPEGMRPLEEVVRTTGAAQLHLELGPLDTEDAHAVCRELLGPDAPELADAIVRDAQGSPFFLTELARYVRAREPQALATVTLDNVLSERVAGLSSEAQRVFEVIALAGVPISRRAVALASDLRAQVARLGIDALRAEHFVRETGERSADTVEPLHDRYRKTVTGRLEPARRRGLHRSLARALSELEEASAEQLVIHWLGAGESALAATNAKIAAEAAVRGFDFDHAANLYKLAIDHGAHSPDEARALWLAHAEALSNAGRPAEASRAFEHAGLDLSALNWLEVKARSSRELMRGGYMAEGLEAAQEVLARLGIRLTKSVVAIVFWIVAYRLWIALRGFAYARRSAAEIPREEGIRVDLLGTLCTSLSMVDPLHGAEYEARFLVAALRLGETRRLLRALGMEIVHHAVLGHEEAARRVCRLGDELARAGDDPVANTLVSFGHGCIDYFVTNDFRAAATIFEVGAARLREESGASGFEPETLAFFHACCLLYLGELATVTGIVAARVSEAQRKGDRCAEVNFRTRLNMAWLVRDDAHGAARELEEAAASWNSPTAPFLTQHYYALLARCEAALYAGDPRRAEASFVAGLGSLRRSLLLKVLIVRAEVDFLSGRIALALGAGSRGSDRAACAQRARTLARGLQRQRLPVARHTALLLDGSAELLDGRREAAERRLREAVAQLDASKTGLYGHAARLRLGELVGGDEGAALCAEARAWAAAQGVKNPARLFELLLPNVR